MSAHHQIRGEGINVKLYVDTPFVQAAVTHFGGDHVGFGDFVISVNGHTVGLNRSGRVTVEEFEGRVHRVDACSEDLKTILAAIESEEITSWVRIASLEGEVEVDGSGAPLKVYCASTQPSCWVRDDAGEGSYVSYWDVKRVMAEEALAAAVTLIFHTDPGHGWVQVDRQKLRELGIEGEITSCSYQSSDGKTCYLEEGLDAGTLIRAIKATGTEVLFDEEDSPRDESFVRSLPRYRP